MGRAAGLSLSSARSRHQIYAVVPRHHCVRVEPLALPVRSPNLNAYSERWVRSVKQECLSKVLLIGERSLRLALSEYVAHYHAERNHQGKDNH
jgi:Integrase core domain